MTGVGRGREEAVQNALRNAVAQEAGAFVRSERTLKDSADVLKKRIYTQAHGYVSNYTVIESSVRSQFGVTSLNIQAEVGRDSLRKDLAAANLIYELADKPRIMVLVADREAKKTRQQRITAGILENHLISKGFRVVDPAQYMQSARKEFEYVSDNNKIGSLGFRNGADLVLVGTTEAGNPEERDLYGTKNYMVSCLANLRAVRTDLGQVIAAEKAGLERGSTNRAEAVTFAITKTAEVLCPKISDALLAYWSTEAYNTKPVEIVVKNADIASLQRFLKEVKAMEGVRNIRLRYLEQGNAVLDAEIMGMIQYFREDLVKKTSVRITALTMNRIELEYGAKAPEAILTQFDVKPEKNEFEIQELDLDRLFASKCKYYSSYPVGKIVLRNNTQRNLENVNVNVRVRDLAGPPNDQAMGNVRANSTASFPVNLAFSEDKILGLAGNATMSAQVQITGLLGGKRITRSLNRPITIYHKNAFDWGELDAIGSFVAPETPAVSEFARAVVASLEIDEAETPEKSLLHAAAIFDAVSLAGMRYVSDPNGAMGGVAIDNLQFPHETLRLKTGDCDDMSILYASLLESIGIGTAILSYPDHVLVMVNTGLRPKNGDLIAIDSTRFVQHQGWLWIPVETIFLAKGSFPKAWGQACADFSDALASGTGLGITVVRDAWNKYPPLTPTGKPGSVPVPDAGALNADLRRDLAAMRAQNEKEKTAIVKALQGKEDGEASSRLARLHVETNRLAQAKQVLEKAHKRFKKDIRILNNLGNVSCLMGEKKQAAQWYAKAQEKAPKNGGIYLNAGLCSYTFGDESEAVAMLRKGIALLGGRSKVEEVLGISLEQVPARLKGADKTEPAQDKSITRAKMKLLIQKALRDIPDKEIKAYGKSALPTGGLRGADPSQVQKVAQLLWWM